MIRFIMFIILLVVIFFSGVSIGAENHVTNNESAIINIESESNINSLEREQWDLADPSSITEKPLFIEKIARSLEKVFFVFFEIIVELLYQITKFFF